MISRFLGRFNALETPASMIMGGIRQDRLAVKEPSTLPTRIEVLPAFE